MNKRELGKLGEQLAVNFYLSKGYKIINKNWYCRYGEIDLITKPKSTNVSCIYFVEVKLRTKFQKEAANYKCYPIISKYKLSKIRKCITAYLSREGLVDIGWQLDALYIYKLRDRIQYIRKCIFKS